MGRFSSLVELMQLNLPELAEVLEEIEFFERERTDRQSVELAILLYNHGVIMTSVAFYRSDRLQSGGRYGNCLH